MLKRNSLVFVLLGLTSCCRFNCGDQGCCGDRGQLEIPCTWRSAKEGMALEDPSYFRWWEALNDPILTSLIMEATCRNRDVLLACLKSRDSFLKSLHEVSAEVAQNYITFCGLQLQLNNLSNKIDKQSTLLTLNKGLSKEGFFSEERENEDQKRLESLFLQRSQLILSKEKTLFRLSTLLNESPEMLAAFLCKAHDLPRIPEDYPIGSPADLICQDLSIKEARKQYRASGAREALYNYQKMVLTKLENTETALAAFNYEKEKLQQLENVKNLQYKNDQLTKYLNGLGLKDDREALLSSQELLKEEYAVIQGKIDLLNSYVNLYQNLSCSWEN